jgi:hypothetical protein
MVMGIFAWYDCAGAARHYAFLVEERCFVEAFVHLELRSRLDITHNCVHGCGVQCV